MNRQKCVLSTIYYKMLFYHGLIIIEKFIVPILGLMAIYSLLG